MQIEVGKEYRTRDGRKAMVTIKLNHPEYYWMGHLKILGEPIQHWRVSGHSTASHACDLIALWEEPTVAMPVGCAFCGAAWDGKCNVKVIPCRRGRGPRVGPPVPSPDLTDSTQQDTAQVESLGALNQVGLSDYLSGIQGYAPLEDVLAEAAQQAAFGKGKERHANGKPFANQPILEITRSVGLGFPTGQVCKKTQEAVGMVSRGQHDQAVEELLGAIVYAAAAIIQIRESAK